MLEGAFYGLDLLKLHSVTTKLVGRVDKLEEVRKSLGFHIFLLIRPQSASNLPYTFLQKACTLAVFNPLFFGKKKIYTKHKTLMQNHAKLLVTKRNSEI